MQWPSVWVGHQCCLTLRTRYTTGGGSTRKRQLSHDASQMLLTVLRVGRFIRAAQYVIVLIVAFTLAWLPWIIVFYVDVVADNYVDPGYKRVQARDVHPASFNEYFCSQGGVQL